MTVTVLGSFTFENRNAFAPVPKNPGRYWTLAKPVDADNEANTATLRPPSMAGARAALKREAEAAKSEIELKPCQSVRNYKPPLAGR